MPLAQTMRNCSESELHYAADSVIHYATEFEQAATANDPPSVAHTIHMLVDESMTRNAKAPIQADVKCRRGCNACCHLHVDVYENEAALLVMAIDDGLAIDRERLARQAGKTLETWAELSPSDRRCVFNDAAGDCTVYEYRPVACRKYQVVTPPEHCDATTHPGHEVGALSVAQAEIFDSAAMLVFRSGPLAAMMSERLERRAKITR